MGKNKDKNKKKNGNFEVKKQERMKRKQIRSHKYKEDPEWKKEFVRFELQLKKIGYQIVDVPGALHCFINGCKK